MTLPDAHVLAKHIQSALEWGTSVDPEIAVQLLEHLNAMQKMVRACEKDVLTQRQLAASLNRRLQSVTAEMLALKEAHESGKQAVRQAHDAISQLEKGNAQLERAAREWQRSWEQDDKKALVYRIALQTYALRSNWVEVRLDGGGRHWRFKPGTDVMPWEIAKGALNQ